jgi:hypothetical protein
MAPTGQEVNMTDRERLIRIETLVDGMAKSNARLEHSLLDLVTRLEKRQDSLDKAIADHVNEDVKSFKAMKFDLFKAIIIAAVMLLIGMAIPGFGG